MVTDTQELIEWAENHRHNALNSCPNGEGERQWESGFASAMATLIVHLTKQDRDEEEL